MKGKGDRLMLPNKIWYMKQASGDNVVSFCYRFYVIVDSPRKANLVPLSSLKHILGTWVCLRVLE